MVLSPSCSPVLKDKRVSKAGDEEFEDVLATYLDRSMGVDGGQASRLLRP
jgi:hypothetical protein